MWTKQTSRVSYDFNSYLSGAREGDTVVVDAKAVKAGKTLAYLECELRHKNTGKIIAKGSQTKYVAPQGLSPSILDQFLDKK